MNKESKQRYRSAIALNNMAVSLLARSCYSEACETMKDAVSCIKAASTTGSNISEEVLDQKIYLARRRLAAPASKRREVVQIEVLATNVSCAKIMGSILSQESMGRTWALRIEDFDFTKGSESEFESAIILYNLGVAYNCALKAAGAKRKAGRQPRTGAPLRLFRISHSIIAKAVRKETNIQNPELLLVLGVVLFTLIQTLLESERHAEARPFSSMLEQLKLRIHDAPAMFGIVNGGAAAA